MTTHDIEEFWHNHAGARWLVPMMALLAVVLIGVVAMIVYPHVSA